MPQDYKSCGAGTRFYCNICDNMKRVFNYLLSLAFFGFEKPVIASPYLAHLFFEKSQQKTKELNYLPKTIRCASHLFAHLPPVSHRRFACGSMASVYFLNVLKITLTVVLISNSINTFITQLMTKNYE